ncbi:hypothetical protein FPF71_09365 [Algibacter amylolyticus]|uniref:Uncharacterized protein n=1 Tax=Algibacter amylolyticus TaxID=1608400 RepID=A0A5M7BA91_9FLAO|nr:hypothetical protein [Algibacter amylolyticus]KAA5824381.1 hypothetical protein F2B50_09365 [Algibacter amylolyticus]MBB5269562.1 hypothetical protein [Algibacter amylolyticus]TSJ75154.1 hypothetical protein FPF71_09365 [Algibacter amylolyticus]
MKQLIQQPNTLELIVKLVEILIWPLTLLIILFLFRKYLAKTFERLGSIKADRTGLSLTFEKKLTEAKQLLQNIQPNAVSKSAPQISITPNGSKSPYQQLVDLKVNLENQLVSLAKSNTVDPENLTSIMLSDKLKETGVLSINNEKLISAILDIINSADSSISQQQVNEVKTLYNNVKFN